MNARLGSNVSKQSDRFVLCTVEWVYALILLSHLQS
jgi:hypothetical protein